jgi:hypothetical protein
MHVRCCGHSLGGALSTLCALDLAKRGYTVKLITWASPRVGDAQFVSCVQKAVERQRLQIARFVNGHDPVPYLPPEKLGFKHVCEEIRLDAWVSAVMGGSAVAAHSLATYATNLANCFRDQVELVSAVEIVAGVATFCRYACMEVVPFVMAASQGPAGVCNWLTANKTRATYAVQRDVIELKHEVIELKQSLGALHGLVNQATSELKQLMSEHREQDKVDAVLASVMTLSTASREQASMDSTHPALTSLRNACYALLLHLPGVVKEFLTEPKTDSSRSRLARQVDVICIGFLAELQVIHNSGDAKRYQDRRDEIAEQLYSLCLRDLLELKANGVFDARTACVSVIFVVQLLFERRKPELVIARARVHVCEVARSRACMRLCAWSSYCPHTRARPAT